MKKNPAPIVSVVIVNYNGIKYLSGCLDPILKNSFKSYEIIVVDNGSTDETAQVLNEKYSKYKQIHPIYLGENRGPALARNIGVNNSNGEYLAFLDNDTKPVKDWLKNAVKCLEDDKSIGAIQCKLLLMDEPDRIDYVGDYLTNTGFLAQIATVGQLEKNIIQKETEIFAAKSAGMIVRKEAFNKAGGFDEDYFMYVEETDLCWRIWLAGYRIIYLPTSVIYHKFGTTYRLFPVFQNYLARFHGTKNYVLTMIKNLGTVSLIKILPLHLTLWLCVALYQFITLKFNAGFYILSGLVWNITHLGDSLRKRRLIQMGRKISERKLMNHVLKDRGISYFLNKFFSKSTVSGIKTINE